MAGPKISNKSKNGFVGEVLRKNQKLLVCGQHIDEPRCFTLPMGEFAFYTVPRPDKDTVNEDAIGVKLISDQRALFVIADGLGGHRQGAEASKKVVDHVLGSAGRLEDFSPLHGIQKAHRAIERMRTNSGSTVVAVEWDNHRVRFYSVGDSMGLLLTTRGRVKYKTFEHSITGFGVESGLLDGEKALEHKDSHVILNALGFDDSRIEMSFQLSVNQGEVFVLVSDGVTGNLSLDDIVAQVSTGNALDRVKALKRMLDKKLLDGGGQPDDIAVLVFRRSETISKK